MKTRFILVTGGCGFIGSNFIRYVMTWRPTWHIINLDALTYAGNPDSLKDVAQNFSDRYHFWHGNICDADLLNQILHKYQIDGLFHFAAESHVDRSIVSPDAFVQTNVVGTFNLLEFSRKMMLQLKSPEHFRFLHVSTDEVYGSLGNSGFFNEDSPYDPSSPYSASKAASDHLVRAYFRTYQLPILLTNCSNNFGPYQFPEKLIPLMILNIFENQELPIYGDGKNVRDWLFVLDHCEALLAVFENGLPGETYNIGGNAERQNIQIVYQLCKILDHKLKRKDPQSSRRLIRFVDDRPGHDRRYAIDARKIKKELGWQPQYPFEDALEITVDWYLNNHDWVNTIRSGNYRHWIELNYSHRFKNKSPH